MIHLSIRKWFRVSIPTRHRHSVYRAIHAILSGVIGQERECGFSSHLANAKG